MAGVQVQIARCLSPLLFTEDCSHAYIIQRESNRVAESFTGIQPSRISRCAVPQRTSLTSPQDSENRAWCTCWDPVPNDVCWYLHTGHPMRGSNKNYQGSLILTVELSAFGDWLSNRQNIQFPKLFFFFNKEPFFKERLAELVLYRMHTREWCVI